MIRTTLDKFKGLNTSLQTLIFVITVLILFLVIVFQSLTIVQMRHKVSTLDSSIVDTENDNKLLVEQVQKTSTEKYVEKIAKDKLGMVRSNEIPVKVEQVKMEEKKEDNTRVLQSKDKAGIYLKEWYSELDSWFQHSKKG